ncbi:hypothetical protein Clacol_006262 [Clathrus columnatus]|uniref:Protein-serine/threonine kinase n=1 Tax=Clathrus columnatus TaxID=1419009 RepID=A0AAV5AE76_9AGAM|nr:hypothetical protein Clacol_006262 [Clathrus columnatus]
MNPFLSRTLKAYRNTFQALATYPPVLNMEDNWKFTQRLEGIVMDHTNDIPTMAKGFQECSRYMSSNDISDFLNHAIRSRIAVRLIAEQHIALSHALRESGLEVLQDTGVVDMHCSPAQMVRMCSKFVADLCEATLGISPTIVVDGHVDATFPYVPVHLEFALTELLKNAFRATVEHHQHNVSKKLPPIIVTISSPPEINKMIRVPMLTIRIRDQGGGVAPSNLPVIFSYAFTTSGRNNDGHDQEDDSSGGPYAAQQVGGIAAFGDGGQGEGNLFGEITGKGLQTGMGTLSGLGYGLPLAKLYATYFGGDLQLVSLYNHGTDVFLSLRCLQQTDASII